MAPAMPCKRASNSITEVFAQSEKIPKTLGGCIVESHESTRHREESSQPKNQEDHTAGKGFTSMSHFNLVNKFNPMRQAMIIRDAKAAVVKEWKKLETIPAWQLEKVKMIRNYRKKKKRKKKTGKTDGSASETNSSLAS